MGIYFPSTVNKCIINVIINFFTIHKQEQFVLRNLILLYSIIIIVMRTKAGRKLKC